MNVNDYLYKDAAIFKLSFKEKVEPIEEESVFKLDVFMYSGKLNPTSFIRNKQLFNCTYEDFEVKAAFITNKTNDRMKEQKGAMLCFKKCVIVNGLILMPLDFGNITKYRINAANSVRTNITKQKIYECIVDKHKAIDYDHLMDPYLYFMGTPLS